MGIESKPLTRNYLWIQNMTDIPISASQASKAENGSNSRDGGPESLLTEVIRWDHSSVAE